MILSADTCSMIAIQNELVAHTRPQKGANTTPWKNCVNKQISQKAISWYFLYLEKNIQPIKPLKLTSDLIT